MSVKQHPSSPVPDSRTASPVSSSEDKVDDRSGRAPPQVRATDLAFTSPTPLTDLGPAQASKRHVTCQLRSPTLGTLP